MSVSKIKYEKGSRYCGTCGYYSGKVNWCRLHLTPAPGECEGPKPEKGLTIGNVMEPRTQIIAYAVRVYKARS